MLIAARFVPEPVSSSAADFHLAARENSKAVWLWAGSTVLVCFAGPLWTAAIPALVALHAMTASLSCRRHAQRLRDFAQSLRDERHGAFLDRNYALENDVHMARPRPGRLFAPCVYDGAIRVGVNQHPTL